MNSDDDVVESWDLLWVDEGPDNLSSKLAPEKLPPEKLPPNAQRVLRAPFICVLGHVDTGKTSLLDRLRKTHVQAGEAGGITQQISATNLSMESIRTLTGTTKVPKTDLPGLLIFDTPGHESFSNLRSRGSSLCDFAILVVDLMHGLENQTLESIRLLKEKKTPFVVALNKIDRLYGWQSDPQNSVADTLQKQSSVTQNDFQGRVQALKVDFAIQELNTELFFQNRCPREFISLVPISAQTGDGVGDLLTHLCKLCRTFLSKRLTFSEELETSVLEVRESPGLGTIIDLALVNGRLREGDQLILSGREGPFQTQIRSLRLGPGPPVKEVRGSQVVQVVAKDLAKALPCQSTVRPTGTGVYVHASTQGSMEALLEFLGSEQIPFGEMNIGPVHKRDVVRASRDPEWAVILAFDVKVSRDAQQLADNWKPNPVRIFRADVIYHLADTFLKHREALKQAARERSKDVVVFPCALRVLPNLVFNSRQPIICGVKVEQGHLHLGTPLIVPSKGGLSLGRVTSIESNNKPVDRAREGEEVCVKIEGPSREPPKMFGRHFSHTDLLVSRLTHESVRALREHFSDELTESVNKLIKKII